MDKKYYTIIVDDTKFTILKATLAKYSDSTIYKCIMGKLDDQRICINGDLIYIDADIDSFKYIISYIRGYQVVDIPPVLQRKVYYDATHFNIVQLAAILEQIVPNTDTVGNQHLTDTAAQNQKKESSSLSSLEGSDKKMKNIFADI
jgi:hypothetical protein